MYRLNEDQQRVVREVAAVADEQIAPHAERVDREGVFPRESIAALGDRGLMGLTIPAAFGGLGHNLRAMAAALDEVAQCCSSTAMIYLMHLCGVARYGAAPEKTGEYLKETARGRHLSTIAFSESGSRSHFWAPVSREVSVDSTGGVRISAKKSFAADATQPLQSTIYLALRDDGGVSVSAPWRGMGMRGNASAAMAFEGVTVGADRALTASGKGLDLTLGVVLPAFQVGSAAVALGIAEASVQATTRHLTSSRLEHMNSSLADLPTLRARLVRMRIETDRARAHLGSVLDSLEAPGPMTQLLVLEAKAAATEAVVAVTDAAMRACGGAAFGGAHGLDRRFRDARGPIVMATTTDQAYDFIGRALCGLEVF